VLVDTSVWSVALRRRPAGKKLNAKEQTVVQELSALIDESRACMAGCIRQEVLSGIPSAIQFDQLRQKLRPFEDLPAEPSTHERAAGFYNECRARGVQGSHVDFLICALAHEHRVPIFTLDQDFDRYAEPCRVALHRTRG
jgi:predicted nucleic acid-binding protein